MLEHLEAKAEKDPQVLERLHYKVLQTVRPKAEHASNVIAAFTEEEKYEVDVTLTKKQKSVLQGLVGSVHKNLVERVIPEYKRRGNVPEYLERAEKKAVFLETLWRKFK
jgi:hypothetical protein